MFDIIVIGGGIRGVFAALQCARYHPQKRIALFERRKQLLPHSESRAGLQTRNGNRTRKQLLKTLADSSIEIYRSSGIGAIRLAEGQDPGQTVYEVISHRAPYYARHLILACGQDSVTIKILKDLGLHTRPLSPAAFQLCCDDPRIQGLKSKDLHVMLSWVKSGPPRKRIHIPLASTRPEEQALKQLEGPISIHSGRISGTAVQQLSNHIAKQMEVLPERLKICVNWLPEYGFQGILDYLQVVAKSEAQKTVVRTKVFDLPTALWSRLVAAADIARPDRWKELLPVHFQKLAVQLSNSQFLMKPDLSKASISEFQGGILPENLHPDRPESLHFPGLYFVGSVLDRETVDLENKSQEISDHEMSWIQRLS